MKNLIEFTCPKCEKLIAWANESASVYCKECDEWIQAKDLENMNPAKIDPTTDQLLLF